MISRNELKYYSALLTKKFRRQENKFIAEGLKIVEEGIKSAYYCEAVFVTHSFYDSKPEVVEYIRKKSINVFELKSSDFQRLSETKSPQGIAAVFRAKQNKFDPAALKDDLVVLIDNISDPGNLGTILRTCDWFGIYTILISSQSVDYLNSKVLRASMGSLFHLKIYEEVNENKIQLLKTKGYKLFVSDTKGTNLNSIKPAKKIIMSFSNEALGPSDLIKSLEDQSITIPGKGRAESLNVSSAAAIILSHLSSKR